jgi:hypothetical protein
MRNARHYWIASICIAALFSYVLAARAAESNALPTPLHIIVTQVPAQPQRHLRAGFPEPPARGDGVLPFANTHNLYADMTVEQGTTGGESWSFPSGTFDASCGQLSWTVTGFPSGVSGSFSPNVTSLTGSTLLSIPTTTQSPFGVFTISITATCTKVPTTGQSAGGTTQTVGIYQYPPDPTASASVISLTIPQGSSGTFKLVDSATAAFSPLTWQTWGSPGTATLSQTNTTGPPFSNSLTVAVGATAAPGAYALSADVISNSSYGESSPIVLYVSIVTPVPTEAPSLVPSAKPTATPKSGPTPTPAPTPTSTPSPVATSTAVASTVYASILSALKAGTTVPVLLPTNVSMVLQNIHANLIGATTNQYTVYLGSGSGCYQAESCTQIEIYGQSLTASPTPPPLSGTSVTLANGTAAYFTPMSCGGSCNLEYISWKTATYQYSIGVKSTSEADALAVANSMTAY